MFFTFLKAKKKKKESVTSKDVLPKVRYFISAKNSSVVWGGGIK